MASTAAVSESTSAEAYAACLYERHHRAIFRFCLRQLRRREDADDAAQTTFLYALLSLRKGVVPQLEVPWLLAIARNVCSTRHRSRSRRSAHESPHDLDSVQHLLAGPERVELATSEDFREALAAIPEGQRRALLLREWQGLSYDEIGAELGLSQPATEALLFRARRSAAKQLEARTGLRALNGISILSFLRHLVPSAAGKTVAAGACAALTIGAIPAARPGPSDAAVPPPQTAPSRADALARAPGGERPRHALHSVLPDGSSDPARARTPEDSDPGTTAGGDRSTEPLPARAEPEAQAAEAPRSEGALPVPAPLEPAEGVDTVTDALATVGVPLIPASPAPPLPDVTLPVPEPPAVELPPASVEGVIDGVTALAP
jgi:RNA polymerase sigma factor (sigma-70 family)